MLFYRGTERKSCHLFHMHRILNLRTVSSKPDFSESLIFQSLQKTVKWESTYQAGWPEGQDYVHWSLHTEMPEYSLLVPKVKADVSKLPALETAPRAFSYLQPCRIKWLRSCTKYSSNLESCIWLLKSSSWLLKHNALILKIHNSGKSSDEHYVSSLNLKRVAALIIWPQSYHMLEMNSSFWFIYLSFKFFITSFSVHLGSNSCCFLNQEGRDGKNPFTDVKGLVTKRNILERSKITKMRIWDTNETNNLYSEGGKQKTSLPHLCIMVTP